ncbi:MAG TPA: ABC transporter ATP-binding protein [Nitrospira sp.]|nr:ABC transporter ATP-binding protein [Nitrospira sp.]
MDNVVHNRPTTGWDWMERLHPFLSAFRHALRFVWQSSPKLAVAGIALRTIQGLMPLAVLYFTKLLIDGMTERLNAPPAGGSFTPVAAILAWLAAIAIFSAMLTALASLVARVHAQVVTDHMHTILQAKSVEVDLEYYENAKYQDTLHRAQQEAPYRPTAILNALLQVGQEGISLLAMAGILWWLHWSVLPVLLLSAVPFFLVRVRQSNRLFAWERDRTALERQAWYFNWLLTQGTAAKEVRLFDLGARLRRGFQEVRSILRAERIEMERRWALATLAAQGLGVAGVFAVYSFVALRTINGVLTVGDLVMYFQAIQRASAFLEGLGGSISSLYESNLFLTTLQEFLSVRSRLPVSDTPRPFPRPIMQGIAFQQVSFHYPDEGRIAIHDLSFTVRPGEHVAFVGSNGAGKTTLVKLLCRLYDPSSGRITIDGVDLRDYAILDVRGAVSGIFQDFVKYQMTAAENIALGVGDANVDRTAIVQAAGQAGIHQVIERLPHGYDSLLGKLFDGGHELSIGEWQKIALARAVLRDSQIVILDEPTSAMDAKAEAELFERFHELAKGRMAILISHRLSTVKMADCIYVVEDGRIAEQGTHDGLMRKQGLYATLFSTQAQHYRQAV